MDEIGAIGVEEIGAMGFFSTLGSVGHLPSLGNIPILGQLPN